MLMSGDYEKSSNPIESLKNILKSANDYKPFEDAYEDSEIDAINAAKALDKEFPGINITGETYVKTKRMKKVTKVKELNW